MYERESGRFIGLLDVRETKCSERSGGLGCDSNANEQFYANYH